MFFLRLLAVLFLLVAAQLPAARATDFHWIGDTFATSNCTDSGNWSGFIVPDGTYTAQIFFHDSLFPTSTVNANHNLNALVFDWGTVLGVPAAPPAYTIGGSSLLKLGGTNPKLYNQSTVSQTVNAPIRLDSAIVELANYAPGTTNNRGKLTIGGQITTNGNHNLHVFPGANGIAINGKIVGTIDLATFGPGELTLGNKNENSGDTIVNGGTLRLVGNGRMSDTSTAVVGADGILNLGGRTDAVYCPFWDICESDSLNAC